MKPRDLPALRLLLQWAEGDLRTVLRARHDRGWGWSTAYPDRRSVTTTARRLVVSVRAYKAAIKAAGGEP